jgi:hypothetical protein
VLFTCKGAGVLSLSLSLTGEEGVCGQAICLQGCAHPLHRSERERERERERKNMPRIIFSFKRNVGCLGTFSLSSSFIKVVVTLTNNVPFLWQLCDFGILQ